jgi:hypothetical protein
MFRVDKFHKSIVLFIQTLMEIEEIGYVAFQGNKYQLTSYLWTAWLMATESPAHSWQRAAFNKCVFTLYLSRLLSMDCLATVSKMSIARGYLPQLSLCQHDRILSIYIHSLMTWASSKKYKSLQESQVTGILDHKIRVHISALHNEGKNNKRGKKGC